MSATHDAIWEWDLITNTTYYSPRWYQMLGYSDQQFPMDFEAWKCLCHPDDLQSTVQKIQSVLADPGSAGYQAEFRMKNNLGQWIWILGRGNVVQRSADGSPLLLSGTNTDITERKKSETAREQLQAQLLQSQKMEAIGQLAGGVAHDFNNMLCVIIGQTDLALARPNLDLHDKESFLTIQKAALHSADLTRQLLGFARKQTVLPKRLDLNQVVAGTLHMLRRLIGEHITLNWKPCIGSCMVKMDPSQIDQILTNVCINARDAIKDHGQITLETMHTTIDCDKKAQELNCPKGSYVALAISDTGSGMTSDIMNRIFEPFFTTKPLGKGTGLGLSTVFGIVQQNCGAIEVSSTPGHGTTFVLFFPELPASGSAEGSAPLKSHTPTGEVILVVEDEASLLEIMSTMLRDSGYTVLPANSGAKALEIVAQHKERIDLLFSDVIMPDINGRELHQKILATRPEIKCLYCSGYTSDIIAKQDVLEAGISFLQKPFDFRVLIKTVQSVLHPEAKRQ
jgi:PAS domain S-box-containing protein